jgi:hypothetical protein
VLPFQPGDLLYLSPTIPDATCLKKKENAHVMSVRNNATGISCGYFGVSIFSRKVPLKNRLLMHVVNFLQAAAT